MKTRIMMITALLLAGLLAAGTVAARDLTQYTRGGSALGDEYGRASYSLGVKLATDFMGADIPLNPELVARGMNDVLNGETPLVTMEQVQENLQQLQMLALAKQQEKLNQLAEENKAEGEAFFKENGARSGVMTTASGLQYEVLKEGEGATPKETDNVSVDYRGSFIDGTEFDSSYKRGEPVSFSVQGVIPGWTEALQLMKEGGKLKIYVPSDLAYGPQGSPPVIEPNKTLVFEVELHKIL